MEIQGFNAIIEASRNGASNTTPALTNSIIRGNEMANASLPNHTFSCKTCSTEFKSYNPNPQFCSKTCKDQSQIADVSFLAAVELYESGHTQVEVAAELGTTQKVIHGLFRRNGYRARTTAKRNQSGEANHMWKGDAAGYAAFHRRLYARFGKPAKCGQCGTDDPSKKYDYANLTGQYENIDDYLPMCRSCHWVYDEKHKNFKGAIGGRPSSRKGGDANASK